MNLSRSIKDRRPWHSRNSGQSSYTPWLEKQKFPLKVGIISLIILQQYRIVVHFYDKCNILQVAMIVDGNLLTQCDSDVW